VHDANESPFVLNTHDTREIPAQETKPSTQADLARMNRLQVMIDVTAQVRR